MCLEKAIHQPNNKKRDQFTDNSPTEKKSDWTNELLMIAILMSCNYVSEIPLSFVY